MIGLNLTKLEDASSSFGAGVYRFTFPSIKVISYCTGATRLANAYIFNLLSKYNATTGCGSIFRSLIATPILSTYSKDFALVLVSDELAALKGRFLAIQNAGEPNRPPIERLKNVEIKKISVDLVNGVEITAILTTEAGTNAYIVL
jgi:hypothetical protein